MAGGGRRIARGTVSFILSGAAGGDGDEQGGPEEGEAGDDAAYLRLSSAMERGPPGVGRGSGAAFVHVHSPSQTGQMSLSSSSCISV